MTCITVSIISLLPLLPSSYASRPALAVVFLVILLPMAAPPWSHTSTLLTTTSSLSIFFYLVWFSILLHVKVVDKLTFDETMSYVFSTLWDPLTCSLFAFGGFAPLSIYASLSMHRMPVLGAVGFSRKQRRTSFTALSLVACLLSIGLTLPLLFVRVPHRPVSNYPI